MTSTYYLFALRQWKKGRITSDQVNSYVPVLITAEEANEILNTLQEV